MKIMIQRVTAQSGKPMPRFAYIKANRLERITLHRMMKAGRHNLRPARNWPGPAEVGASFILKPKGRRNVDPGRSPLPSKFMRLITTPMFTIIDMLPLVGLSMLYVATERWMSILVWTSVVLTTLVSGLMYYGRIRSMKR